MLDLRRREEKCLIISRVDFARDVRSRGMFGLETLLNTGRYIVGFQRQHNAIN